MISGVVGQKMGGSLEKFPTAEIVDAEYSHKMEEFQPQILYFEDNFSHKKTIFRPAKIQGEGQ